MADGPFRKLLAFRSDLERFNRARNLYSRRGPEGLLDSLILEGVVAAIQLPLGGRMLDIGSGGGLPGIPVAILHESATVALMERRRGRCDFLRREKSSLDLSFLEVHEGDARDFASSADHRAQYDWVHLKAVAPPSEALRLAAPFLASAGQVALYQGVDWGPGALEPDLGVVWVSSEALRGPGEGPAIRGCPHLFPLLKTGGRGGRFFRRST